MRWMVLRGFNLYWYRSADHKKAKGVFILPCEPIKVFIYYSQFYRMIKLENIVFLKLKKRKVDCLLFNFMVLVQFGEKFFQIK
jgi:hypothetical protein